MIVRAITADEYTASCHISDICFRFDRPTQYNDTGDKHLNTYAAFTDEGVMTSRITGKPYQTNFWGHTVGMCGISGVTTLPEFRRFGHIRALLTHVLQESYKKGDVISTLYPFSNVFYRKFGYEANGPMLCVDLNLKALEKFPSVGMVSQYQPGSDDSDIRKIYAAFVKNRNLACERTDEMWAKRLNKDPYSTHVFTYVIHTDEGEPLAYCTFLHRQDQNGRSFDVEDFGVTSALGFRALLGFFKVLSPSGRTVSLLLPRDINPHFIIPEGKDIPNCVIRNRGMVRVINVEQALALHPWAEGTAFSVAVTDPCIPENNSCFHLQCQNGRTVVTRGDEQTGDITCPIGILSELLTGCVTLQDALFCFPDLIVTGDVDALNACFPINNLYLIEDF